MATMNISLPDKMKEWVEAQVAKGQHSNVSDYIRAVLRKEQDRADYNAYLQNAVDEAMASGFSEMTVDDFFNKAQTAAQKRLASEKKSA